MEGEMYKGKSGKIAIILCFFIVLAASVYSKDLSYQELSIEDISKYNEDRMAYQQIEYIIDPEVHQKQDTSIASLLIIREKKMYLFKDGFDDHHVVEQNKVIKEMENRLVMNELWTRNIDNKPDYLLITDRRTEVLKKVIVAEKDDNLNETYTKFYTNMRDAFIQKHVSIFRGLMINRKDAEFRMNRIPIPKSLTYNGPTKYFTYATAKTKTGEVYYAEDADGDGTTETFTVELPDGFHWGFKSGPNIILILKNKQENIKKMIGSLTTEAYEGTPEEEKIINKQFDKLNKDIPILMDDLIKMDFETKNILKEAGVTDLNEKHDTKEK